MPICPQCGRSVWSSELFTVPDGINSLRCKICIEDAEEIMSNEKPIFTLTITEIPGVSPEVESDYRISAQIHHGGLSLEFNRTVEQIRGFFTERKAKNEQRQLREGKSKLKTV